MREAVDVAPYSELSTPSAVAELVEAAARAGERAHRGTSARAADAQTRPSGTDWALGVEARSRALLSDGDAADRLYQEAIERLRRTACACSSRGPICSMASGCGGSAGAWTPRAASHGVRDVNEMGIEAFAGRAERELLATGERVRKRSVETREQLTAQEVDRATARDGLSNAEIGSRLFISQHTVAYHLRKVFHKLDITSRNNSPGCCRGRKLAEPGSVVRGVVNPDSFVMPMMPLSFAISLKAVLFSGTGSLRWLSR